MTSLTYLSETGTSSKFRTERGDVVMLNTKLRHVESLEQIEELLKGNAKVMICCGRMGPMCIPVYNIMGKLAPKYSRVQMGDMDFDIPAAAFIKN
jgi:thioredoxin 1